MHMISVEAVIAQQEKRQVTENIFQKFCHWTLSATSKSCEKFYLAETNVYLCSLVN